MGNTIPTGAGHVAGNLVLWCNPTNSDPNPVSFDAKSSSPVHSHQPTMRPVLVRDLRMAAHDPAILYAGIEVGGMVRSRDGGQTWKQLPGLHDDIHCIGLSPARPQTVYVAAARGPYRSDDEGEHWELINQGIERRYALHVSVAPEDADIVLLAVSENSRRLNPQLFRSSNGGRDWQAVDAIGGGEDMVVGIDWDTNSSRRVYAGTDHGRVFYSEDNGESWAQIPVELGTIAVGALAAGFHE